MAAWSAEWLTDLLTCAEKVQKVHNYHGFHTKQYPPELQHFFFFHNIHNVHIAGPIASSFTNRYGCRAVTIAGAVLASIGLAVSAAANNISLLYFTIGVCTGIGTRKKKSQWTYQLRADPCSLRNAS